LQGLKLITAENRYSIFDRSFFYDINFNERLLGKISRLIFLARPAGGPPLGGNAQGMLRVL